MILSRIRDLLRLPRAPGRPGRRRVEFSASGPIYAIGDVHGCLNLLLELEQRIVEDSRGRVGSPVIVMLGDMVDRGQHSAQVLDHLLAPSPMGLERICLAGNHETYMAAFIADPGNNRAWLDFGGKETLASYGISHRQLEDARPSPRRLRQLIDASVPQEHIELLNTLPVMASCGSHIFVHAGVRPGCPIDLQRDADLLWIRDGHQADYREFGKTIVHGHTPIPKPLVSPFRISIDTGAYQSGRLTAVRVGRGETPTTFSVDARGLETINELFHAAR